MSLRLTRLKELWTRLLTHLEINHAGNTEESSFADDARLKTEFSLNPPECSVADVELLILAAESELSSPGLMCAEPPAERPPANRPPANRSPAERPTAERPTKRKRPRGNDGR